MQEQPQAENHHQNGQSIAEFQDLIARQQAEHQEWKKQHTGPIGDFIEWLDEHLVTLTMIGMGGHGGGDDIVDEALAKAITLNVIEYPQKPIVPATTQDKCNVLNWLSNRARAFEESQRRVSPTPTASDLPGTPPVDDDSHLSPSKLAELFGVPAEPLRKRLERWKRNNHNGWIENTERGTNEAKFLFRVGAVRAIIDDLKRATKRPPNVQRK